MKDSEQLAFNSWLHQIDLWLLNGNTYFTHLPVKKRGGNMST